VNALLLAHSKVPCSFIDTKKKTDQAMMTVSQVATKLELESLGVRTQVLRFKVAW
jgi:hypothetical protein